MQQTKSQMLVSELLRVLADELGAANQAELADKLGTSPQSVSRWKHGTTFSLERFIELYERAGGTLGDLIPKKKETTFSRMQGSDAIKVLGFVNAGKGSVSWPESEPEVMTSLLDRAREHPLWFFGHGDPYFLRIDGESMMPAYRHGDLVIVRNTVQGDELPQTVMVRGERQYPHVIFRLGEGDHAEHTVKQLRRFTDKRGFTVRVEAAPLNHGVANALDWSPKEMKQQGIRIVAIVYGTP